LNSATKGDCQRMCSAVSFENAAIRALIIADKLGDIATRTVVRSACRAFLDPTGESTVVAPQSPS
jgi:hypothetical protein